MSVRIVRLGTARQPDEGLRIGTVRYPPRGVPKDEYASRNIYDIWLPVLAPSPEAIRNAKTTASDADWTRFARRYRKEMSVPDPRGVLDVLAALSYSTAFSVGCYCEDESRCHRSILRELLVERGADVTG